MASFYRKLTGILTAYGCHKVREAKGSHEMWYRPITDCRFTVPSSVKKKHMCNAIIKQAGIQEKI